MSIMPGAIKKSFATHPRAQCWSANNPVGPETVALNSDKEFLFRCDKCQHEFTGKLACIARGVWCPFCANKKRCAADVIENCSDCLSKCFASHSKAAFWSSRNELTPFEVSLHGRGKFLFVCNVCDHEFAASLHDITRGRWCPFCSNTRRCEADVIKDCSACFPKCFASHSKAAFWSSKNDLTPFEVSLNSEEKFYFDCDVCSHEFLASLDKIVRGHWCHFCSNMRRCDPDVIESCFACFSKCFASHPQAAFWSPKNELKPVEVSLNNGRKFWFRCNVCSNEFEARVAGVVRGQWCPHCRYKTEALVHYWCREWYGQEIPVVRGASFTWCTSNDTSRSLPFAIYIEAMCVIVEVDGPHHFRNVANWGENLQERQERDVYKMQCAVQNGMRIVRISQEDVWEDRDFWKEKLQSAIEDASSVIHWLSRDPTLYDQHKEMSDFV